MMRKSILVVAVLFVSFGCATGNQPQDKPLPVDNPADTSVTYLVKAPYDRIRQVATDLLGKRYSLNKPRTGRTSYDTPYWNLKTEYSFFEHDGKKHRSKCSVHIFSFKEYPSYTDVSVDCRVESYSFGFTRGGIHNLFSLWWDWYPEQGLYLTEEVIEEIMRGLQTEERDIIRLRRLEPYEKQLEIIRKHEKQKA